MFHPGETVLHQFTIPYIENIEKIVVSYKQSGRIIYETILDTSDVTLTDDGNYNVNVFIDQLDTMKFNDWRGVSAQLNIFFNNGNGEGRITSSSVPIKVEQQYFRKTLDDVMKPSTLDDYFILASDD